MPSTYKSLNVAVLPTEDLELEWDALEDAVDKGQQILQDELFRRFRKDDASFWLYLGFCDTVVSLSVSLAYWRRVTGRFAEKLVKTAELEALRHRVTVPLAKEEASDLVGMAPFMPGSEYLTTDVLGRLWSDLKATLQGQIKSYPGTVADYIKTLSPQMHLVGRVFFHLVESKKDAYPFAFLATYSTGLNPKGQSKHLPLKHALTEYGTQSRKLLDLLVTVHLAAQESDFIRKALDSGEIFHPLALSAGEAYAILKEIPLYEKSGILCRIPNWWKNRQAGLRVAISMGDDAPTSLGMDALLDFSVRLVLGESVISEEEVRRLLDEAEGLADEMGLGKTVQLLAMLSTLKCQRGRKKKGASLLVIPASLIGNWSSEIERFAPALNYVVAHPSAGVEIKQGRADPELKGADLVITTYALCQRYTWLQAVDWDLVILDEAQAIKNPGAQQTRAVKRLKARNRIIMTGTPIENRLSDLWSLFDFINPGLLGTTKEFTQFTKSLRNDPSGYARLKKVVGPYILRRLKTDKSVITDLPDKVEMKTYAQLTKKQVVLYRGLIKQLKETLEENPDGIQRRGLVLAALMKFKQLCNHPDQYLGQNEYLEDHSGKFQRLRSICETIHDKREKVLVFTQFAEVIEPLRDHLGGVFGHPGLVLHGATPIKKRKQIVDQFQGHEYTPFLVLSLKAGGVGLNLTAANHVIHFDRWWNPAVENQATDRAFRIGQHRNVVVHKFITQGTIEEKIDNMLEDKAELSRRIIPEAGETWITEMNDRELMDMFTLSL